MDVRLEGAERLLLCWVEKNKIEGLDILINVRTSDALTFTIYAGIAQLAENFLRCLGKDINCNVITAF